jgi:opacity protein-like surface antigen
VIGVDAVSGYSPAFFPYGRAKGFDFAETDVGVGYDMGRWMPYVTTGVVLAKPNIGTQPNYVSASQSTNDLFNGPGTLRAAPSVGAGVDYAVTPNLHLDLGVSGGTGFGPPLNP